MQKDKLLIVDDEKEIADLISLYLQFPGEIPTTLIHPEVIMLETLCPTVCKYH